MIVHPLQDEGLVELRDHGISGDPYYHRCEGDNPPYGSRLPGSIPGLLLRKTVVDMLVKANHALAPLGLELYVWDAYRPLALQHSLWAFFRGKLRLEHPEWDDARLRAALRAYVADPAGRGAVDPFDCPPHLTGGAVDLTLRRLGETVTVDMGAGFDHMGEEAETAFFERQLALGAIPADDERLLNRRRLLKAMTGAGFTNYAPEFWHFDWGNRLYQQTRTSRFGAPAEPAWYGAAPYAAAGKT